MNVSPAYVRTGKRIIDVNFTWRHVTKTIVFAIGTALALCTIIHYFW